MFCDNIKNLRIENNLTQEELARILDISRSTVSAWENNKTEADFSTLKKLKEYFGVTYEELLD
ncbi:MAG: helix-turn-helix domain-containing protein [Christensenellales bacterium]|jgi:transcriptional regulator with XRE-family HTH domain